MSPEVAAKVAVARAVLRDLEQVLVAFSGGVDSALVLALSREEVGDRAVALTAVSASMPASELALARDFAQRLGARHLEIASHELEDPRYAANPTNRCYYCKQELYGQAAAIALSQRLGTVVDGFNADDAADHRPGRQAAVEAGVRSPLAVAGLGKSEVRAAARALGLSVWDKPQSPCLASRLPYGTAVTPARLGQVGAAEELLRGLGFREFRVRHHGAVARVELAALELARLLEPAVREQVDRGIKAVGFDFVAVDLEPFRSGRMNDRLSADGRDHLGLPIAV